VSDYYRENELMDDIDYMMAGGMQGNWYGEYV
jgi:hypothetical protein